MSSYNEIQTAIQNYEDNRKKLSFFKRLFKPIPSAIKKLKALLQAPQKSLLKRLWEACFSRARRDETQPLISRQGDNISPQKLVNILSKISTRDEAYTNIIQAGYEALVTPFTPEGFEVRYTKDNLETLKNILNTKVPESKVLPENFYRYFIQIALVLGKDQFETLKSLWLKKPADVSEAQKQALKDKLRAHLNNQQLPKTYRDLLWFFYIQSNETIHNFLQDRENLSIDAHWGLLIQHPNLVQELSDQAKLKQTLQITLEASNPVSWEPGLFVRIALKLCPEKLNVLKELWLGTLDKTKLTEIRPFLKDFQQDADPSLFNSLLRLIGNNEIATVCDFFKKAHDSLATSSARHNHKTNRWILACDHPNFIKDNDDLKFDILTVDKIINALEKVTAQRNDAPHQWDESNKAIREFKKELIDLIIFCRKEIIAFNQGKLDALLRLNTCPTHTVKRPSNAGRGPQEVLEGKYIANAFLMMREAISATCKDVTDTKVSDDTFKSIINIFKEHMETPGHRAKWEESKEKAIQRAEEKRAATATPKTATAFSTAEEETLEHHGKADQEITAAP